MMRAQGMNGVNPQQQHTTVTVPHQPDQQPLVTITPPAIRLTGAQVWTAILSIPTTVAMLASLGIFYVPAKEAELVALKAVVEQVQVAQKESTDAISRLTDAVVGLNRLVEKLPKPKNLTGAVKLR